MAVKSPRRIVIDAGRLIAGTIRDGTSRRLIYDPRLQLFAPMVVRDELKEHQLEIAGRMDVPADEAWLVVDGLLSRLVLLPSSAYADATPEARSFLDAIDPDDTAYLAVGIILAAEGVWTEDRHFRRQQRITPLSTMDLLALLDKAS